MQENDEQFPVVHPKDEDRKPPVTESGLLADADLRAGEGSEPAHKFVGFPVVKYHPVYGKRVANDPNEAHDLFQPVTDWFDSPGEADMHRTDAEAQQVIHHNRHVKHQHHMAALDGREPELVAGPVRNSVQAQESLDAGHPEPM